MGYRSRVKICGMTRLEDALVAAEAGVDALGFVFYEPSPRFIENKNAANITQKLPPFINKVGLFVNAECSFVKNVLASVNLDLLQFHGDEKEAYCRSFGKPYIKAIRMQATTDLKAVAKEYLSAAGLLLDAYDDSLFGGTGHAFDWDMLPANCDLPVILAGGLNVDNVSKAIDIVHPYALDISSGVEKNKGVKDHLLIKKFMQEVRRADQ